MKYLAFLLFTLISLQSFAQTSDSYGDYDGDGIRNALDKCPSTLKGIAVDMHGCPKDTDGDGVPDYLDKQLITPTECQPSDADGIGDCPCIEGCGLEVFGMQCCADLTGPLFIGFSNNSAVIEKSEIERLMDLSKRMSYSPNCKVIVWGQVNDINNKLQHQVAWERVNNFIKLMNEEFGTDKDRFIFKYGLIGIENLIKVTTPGNGMEGPSNLPQPYPELSRNIKK